MPALPTVYPGGVKTRRLAALAAALLAAPATASAAPPPKLPTALPGDATIASVQAERSTWIVGARPSARADAIARTFGARKVGPAETGGYVLARGQARGFAAALGSLYVYSQPNTVAEPLATVPNDPL